jgi:hypothetical protein
VQTCGCSRFCRRVRVMTVAMRGVLFFVFEFSGVDLD